MLSEGLLCLADVVNRCCPILMQMILIKIKIKIKIKMILIKIQDQVSSSEGVPLLVDRCL